MLQSTLRAGIALLFLVPLLSATDSADPAWDAIRGGGHIVLIRHALAPGTGDPPSFTLGDCATQRNLSEEGRAQATRIGARFRENGIRTARVYSSQWCRCLETARLLDLGPVTELPLLNSFFQDREQEAPQTQALLDWLRQQDLSEALVLVTHQVNITALTGVFPHSGEMVVVRRSESNAVEIVARIPAP